ncbi:MAG: DNA internalization-related competence protein ComEC/Rec2 [Bacillota bacterium]|nr:DNA internalization-related competence protein ComEC/Rec2 [Bacillota bacterium]
MKRTLVIVALFIWIFSFVLSEHNYIEMVESQRLDLPSNIKADMQLHSFEGRVTSFDIEKNSMIFETYSPLSDKKIRYKLLFKNLPGLAEEISNQNYHFNIELDLNQNIFRSPKNPYGFDYDYYLFSQGIHGQFYVKGFEVIKTQTTCMHCSRISLREMVSKNLDLRYSPQVGSFLKAILLGDRSDLINYDDYKDMGLAHIFAISGLHFGLIYKLLQKVIKFPSRTIKSIIIMIVLLAFSAWIGPSYSSYRAFALIAYIEISRLLHRNPDVMTGIAFSSLVILMIRPAAILSQSFQLSFYAYFCVAVIYRTFFGNQSTSGISKLFQSIKFSIVLQFLLMPATLFYFHQINIYGFIANSIIVPLIGLILPVALLDLISTIMRFELANRLLSFILSLLIDWMENIIEHLPSELYNPSWFRPGDFGLLIISFALFVGFKSFYLKKATKTKTFYLGMTVIVTLGLINVFPDNKLEIQFVDVGHGDFSVLKYNQSVILIDSGEGYMDCADYLKDQGIITVDAVIISHAHQDHIGGLEKLRKYYDIKNLYVNQETFDVIKSNSKLSDLNLILIEQRNEILWNQVFLDIKPVESTSDTNDNALVVKLEHFDRTGYFLGDISESVIDTLSFDDKIDFVKVPHHGSGTSISESLYSEHLISYAIISHSMKYSMPNADVVGLMRSNGVNVFSTYKNGTVELIINGDTLILSTYLNDNG